MKVAFYTLGCKVNQYETQALEQLFVQRGHQLTAFDGAADAYIINTCTVTAVSDKKSRQMIHRARKDAPDAVIAVCGCYPQTRPEDMDQLPVDLISGTGDRAGFVALVERAVRERHPANALDNAMERRVFEVLPAGALEGRTRCMLKVEDGCANFCSYCIIPYARGRVRSLPPQEAAAQAARLQDRGFRELVVTGIEISSWGQDLNGGLSLIDLIEAVCAAAPACRIRLGSLEPRTVTAEFCARASELPNLCPHFHLSLQSGSDGVLTRMNRRYDTARYWESVALLRTNFDRPGLTTDLIVGFPGETEDEFTETLSFIRRCGFSTMHIFPYSLRPGTRAAAMANQIPNAVKANRARMAAEVSRELERAWLDRWVGETLPVLFESARDGLWHGYTTRYSEVAVESGENLHNQILPVTLRKAQGSLLHGTPASSLPQVSPYSAGGIIPL